MSSRGLRSSMNRGSGRQSSSRGSWRRSGSTAASSTNAGTEGEGPHSENSKGETQRFNPHVRPTHFLSLPLASNPSHIYTNTNIDALLLVDPPIPGLDKSIIVQPSRLHITLGVMTLREDSNPSDGTSRESEVQDTGNTPENLSEPQADPRPKSISEALTLLRGLRGRITEELRTQEGSSSESGAVMVPLNIMGVLRTDKKQTAHVLWMGPKKPQETTALDRVSDLVNKAFREHGFITEKRPLKLHCTILNTKYRKGGSHKRPVPFSTEAIFASDAYRNLMHTPSNSSTTTHVPTPSHGAPIECGTWPIDEIQLCQMGGRDPVTGAYISVGSLKLS